MHSQFMKNVCLSLVEQSGQIVEENQRPITPMRWECGPSRFRTAPCASVFFLLDVDHRAFAAAAAPWILLTGQTPRCSRCNPDTIMRCMVPRPTVQRECLNVVRPSVVACRKSGPSRPLLLLLLTKISRSAWLGLARADPFAPPGRVPRRRIWHLAQGTLPSIALRHRENIVWRLGSRDEEKIRMYVFGSISGAAAPWHHLWRERRQLLEASFFFFFFFGIFLFMMKRNVIGEKTKQHQNWNSSHTFL